MITAIMSSLGKMLPRVIRPLRLAQKIRRGLGLRFFWINRKSIIKKILLRAFFKKNLIVGPISMGIGVSNDCNLKCLYCFEHSPYQPDNSKKRSESAAMKAKMDFAVFKNLVDDLAILNNKLIRFVGRGESFANPDFIEMCEYARSKGQICDITTNGALITEDDAKSIVDSGIRCMDINIGAATPGTHHLLTGSGAGTLDKIFATLRFLEDYKKQKNISSPKTLITNVICSLNCHEIVDMVRRAIEAGVSSVGFHKMYFCKKRLEFVEKLLIREDQLNSLKKQIVDAMLMAKAHKISTNLPFFLKLLSTEGVKRPMNYRRVADKVRKGGVVLGDGAVYAWEYPEVIGNINDASFIAIWYSTRYLAIRKNAEAICQSDRLFPCAIFCRSCDKPLYKQPG